MLKGVTTSCKIYDIEQVIIINILMTFWEDLYIPIHWNCIDQCYPL